MIKKLSAFLAVCVVFVSLALAQQGRKGSTYPQITTVPPSYLFWIIVPNVTNYTISYANLAAQITAGVGSASLIPATNNDALTSNQLYSVIVALMDSSIQAATNPFTPGSFIITLAGNGTNLTLRGTNTFEAVQTANFYPTNLWLGTNYSLPWPTAPLNYGDAYFGNSNGIVYLLQSKQNALVWTKTNLISSP